MHLFFDPPTVLIVRLVGVQSGRFRPPARDSRSVIHPGFSNMPDDFTTDSAWQTEPLSQGSDPDVPKGNPIPMRLETDVSRRVLKTRVRSGDLGFGFG